MTQYVNKSTVVAEINRRLKTLHLTLNEREAAVKFELKDLLSFLDTLEVKEVDFDAEWKRYFEHRGEMATVNVQQLAKHFFELGLKAQKGE